MKAVFLCIALALTSLGCASVAPIDTTNVEELTSQPQAERQIILAGLMAKASPTASDLEAIDVFGDANSTCSAGGGCYCCSACGGRACGPGGGGGDPNSLTAGTGTAPQRTCCMCSNSGASCF